MRSPTVRLFDGKFAYTEVLALLVAAAVPRRFQTKLATRFRRESVRTHMALEEFDFN